MQEYPKMLYPTGDGDPVIVEDATTETTARAAGYAMHYEVLAKVEIDQAIPIPDEIANLDKDALIAWAKEKLGMDMDKRLSADNLRQTIAAKMAG